MDLLTKLKAKADAHLATMKAIAAKASTENRDVTVDEQKSYDAEKAALDATLAKIKEAKARADAEAELAAIRLPAANPDVTGAVKAVTGTGPAVDVADTLIGNAKVGIFAWAAAKAKLNPSIDAYKALEDAGYGVMADKGRLARDTVRKSLLAVSGAGANTVFTPLANEFIEFLRNSSSFLKAGPLSLDMPMGSIDIAGGNAPTQGVYGAEGAAIGYVELTTRKVQLSAKHLRAVTALSNYLIEVSPLNVAMIAGDDLAQGLTVALDAAGLRGDGTGSNPTGVRNLIAAANIFAAAAGMAPAVAAVDTELKRAVAAIRAGNVPERRRVWIMSTRVLTYLQFLRDGNGNPAYPGLDMEKGAGMTLKGYPVIASEQVPSNLGAGTNESEIYFVDFGHVIMGISRTLALTASQEASYVDGAAAHQSAFSRDETVVRGVMSHDFDLRHTKCGSILTAVQWGG